MRNLLILFTLLIPSLCFSQRGTDLQPDDTHALLTLFLVNGAREPVKKAPMQLRSADGKHTFEGTTDKNGAWTLLVPTGTVFLVSVADSADFEVIRLPLTPKLKTKRFIYFQGSIKGKRIEPDPGVMHRTLRVPIRKIPVELTFRDIKDRPIVGERVSLEGAKPGHSYTDSTDENGQVRFTLPSGDLYALRLSYMGLLDRIKVDRMDAKDAYLRGTYQVLSPEELEAMERMAEQHADTLVQGKRVNRDALVALAALADETQGALYVMGNEENPAVVLSAIFGETLGPETDLVLLLDCSGSMSDDIERLKESVQILIEGLRGVKGLRIGLSGYSDLNSDGERWYWQVPFSDNPDAIKSQVQDIGVAGGGDYPESVYDGLWETLERFEWQPGRKKMILLLGDAPPLTGDATRKERADIIRRCKAKGVETNLYPVLIGY